MFSKVVFAAILALTYAQEENSDVVTLQKLTDEGLKAVNQTLVKVVETPNEFDRYIQDRLCSLKWEVIVQQKNFRQSITQAVFKGMLKNKQFSSFQCISKNIPETFNKLDAILDQIPNNTEKIKEKELSTVMPFLETMEGFRNYTQNLYNTKSQEMIKTQNGDARKKILEEVTKKMKLLNSILEQINGQLKASLFKFFEDYVDYAFATEKTLREIQKKGTEAVMKCVFL